MNKLFNPQKEHMIQILKKPNIVIIMVKLQNQFKQLYILRKLMRYKEAIQSFQEAVQLNQYYHEAYFKIGEVYYALSKQEEAVQSYKKAINLNFEYQNYHLSKAEDLIENWINFKISNQKRFEEALQAYKKSILLNPLNLDPQEGIGIVYYFKKIFSFVSKIDQDKLYQYTITFKIILKLNRSGEALALFEKLIEANPNNYKFYRGKGNALLFYNLFNEIYSNYKNMMKLCYVMVYLLDQILHMLKPLMIKVLPQIQISNHNIYLNLNYMMRPQNPLIGLFQLILIMLTHLQTKQIHYKYYQIIKTLLELNQENKALEYYEKAIDADPLSAEAYYRKGLLLISIVFQLKIQKQSRNAEAVQSHDHAVIINSNFIEALVQRDQALESFKKAISINPNCDEAYYGQGNILYKTILIGIIFELNKYNEALDSINQAIAINPKHYQAHHQKGLILYQN